MKCNYDYPSEYWDNISVEAKEFIDSLLNLKYKQRPSFLQIKNHPFLSSTEKRNIRLNLKLMNNFLEYMDQWC